MKKVFVVLGIAALVGAGLFYVFQKESETDKLRRKLKEEEDEDFDYWDDDISEEFEEEKKENSKEENPVEIPQSSDNVENKEAKTEE